MSRSRIRSRSRSGGVSAAQAPLRFASADNVYNDSNPAVSPKASAFADRAIVRDIFQLDGDYSSLAFIDFNDQMTTSSGSGPANTLEIVSASAEYNGVSVPLYIGGNRSYTMADQERNVVYDEIKPSSFGASRFENGEWVAFKAIYAVPSQGDNFVCANTSTDAYTIAGVAQGQFALYNSATATPSSVDATGKFTFVSGSAESNITGTSRTPLLVGRAINRKRIAPLCLVDSIGTRFLNNEFLREQFADNVFSGMKVAVPGISIDAFNTYDNWEWLIAYADDVFIKLGTNDIGGGVNYATFTTRFNTLLNTILNANPNMRIHISNLLANTTSTDSFTTDTNQTTKTIWTDIEPDLRNTYFPSLLSANTIYGLLNTSAVRDPVDEDLWLTDGVTAEYATYDGIHLSNNSDNGNDSIVDSGVGIYNGQILLPYIRSTSVDLFGVDIPSKVTGLGATAGDGQMTLVWSAPEYDGGATFTYTIQYKLSADSSWTTFITGLSAATLTDDVTGLTNNSPYDFRVLAVNSAGYSISATATETPTAVSYDANLSAVFDITEIASITKSSGDVSNWQDARGSSFNYVQATAINRPSQASDGDPIYFGNNEWLTLDTAQKGGWFDIVFENDAAITNATAAANIIHFANAAPTVLSFGASTGVSSDEVIVYSIGTYKAIVTATNLNSDTGSSTIPIGTHIISVRYESGSDAQIWLDGVSLTITNDGSNVQTDSALIPTIGAQDGGSRDFLDFILEVRHYSAAPVTSTSDIHSELMTKWGI